MPHIESHVVIAKPVEEVFARLLDLENARHFDPDVASVEKITKGPIGVGTTFRFHERVPPLGRLGYATATYTAIEPNRRIEMLVRVGPLADTGTLWFEVAQTGTRMTFEGTVNPQGVLKVLSPWIAKQATKTWNKRFAHIKDWMEKPRAGTSQGSRP